jgi:hypothetical protein
MKKAVIITLTLLVSLVAQSQNKRKYIYRDYGSLKEVKSYFSKMSDDEFRNRYGEENFVYSVYKSTYNDTVTRNIGLDYALYDSGRMIEFSVGDFEFKSNYVSKKVYRETVIYGKIYIGVITSTFSIVFKKGRKLDSYEIASVNENIY